MRSPDRKEHPPGRCPNEIVGFENGTKAVEFLFGPDGSGQVNRGNALLIMLDLNLPDMSGVDILKRVKENEHLKRTPVVVLTTTDDEREIKRCYDLGANVYITKPVNYESFANAIRQLGLFFSVIQVPATDVSHAKECPLRRRRPRTETPR